MTLANATPLLIPTHSAMPWVPPFIEDNTGFTLVALGFAVALFAVLAVATARR